MLVSMFVKYFNIDIWMGWITFIKQLTGLWDVVEIKGCSICALQVEDKEGWTWKYFEVPELVHSVWQVSKRIEKSLWIPLSYSAKAKRKLEASRMTLLIKEVHFAEGNKKLYGSHTIIQSKLYQSIKIIKNYLTTEYSRICEQFW